MWCRRAVPALLILSSFGNHHHQVDAGLSDESMSANAVGGEVSAVSVSSKSLTLRGSTAASGTHTADEHESEKNVSSDPVGDAKKNGKFEKDLKQLNSRVSPSGKVVTTDFTDWLQECVAPHKRAGFPIDSFPHSHKYSNYHMKDKPSGLCPLNLYLSFQGGMWNDQIQEVLNTIDLKNTKFDDIKDQLPPMALPAFMSFPQTAKDVVEIVKFANKYGKKISIKNSGHSYTQGSNSADSININMRSFPQYSFKEVYECNEDTSQEPLSGPPCKLALARGKTAVARIGGGQGNDDMFRSVIDYNYMQPRDKRYFALGGAEGMIGGGGGFFQGGGLGIGEERLYGNGADQVLEIEMILPDGKHVKFGPTQWEYKDGYTYPQTMKVEGKCNNNVDHDESEWEWVECPDSRPFFDVTFEDLWFAVRGGGGGVWGVVLSTYMQLHELVPQFILKRDEETLGSIFAKFCPDGLSDLCIKFFTNFVPTFHDMYLDFVIDLFWNVDNNDIGVDEYLSRRCGFTFYGSSASFANPIAASAPPRINCHGHGIQEKFQDAWKKSIESSPHWSKLDEEFHDDELNCLLENLIYLEGGFYDQWRRNSLNPSDPNFFYSPVGQLMDGTGLEGTYRSQYLLVIGIMFPQEYLGRKTQQVRKVMKEAFVPAGGGHTLPYSFTSDGMEPTPELYRSGGIQTGLYINEENLKLISEILSVIGYDPTSGEFPGIFEYNHFYAFNAALNKTDPTKLCPFSFSNEEKKEHCMSVQESVWGTTTLNRLTAIKTAIDPHNLFDVHFGVGNNERSNAAGDYSATKIDPQGPGFVFTDKSDPKITDSGVCTSGLNGLLNSFEDNIIPNEETK